VFWVPLAEMDFNEGSPVKKLTLTDGKTYGGSAAGEFKVAKPFEFLSSMAK
jgi:choloylglycine hydrolase